MPNLFIFGISQIKVEVFITNKSTNRLSKFGDKGRAVPPMYVMHTFIADYRDDCPAQFSQGTPNCWIIQIQLKVVVTRIGL